MLWKHIAPILFEEATSEILSNFDSFRSGMPIEYENWPKLSNGKDWRNISDDSFHAE